MRIWLLAMTLIGAGCATPGDPGPNQASASSKVHCKREVPTGSHRTVVTCRTEEQQRIEKEEARKVLNRPRVRQSSI